MEDFVHLHVHTQYSILDGQSKIPHLVDKAIKDGMKGMAVTDHGVMFGIKELTDYCAKVNKDRKKEGLEPFKPIIGCEMYVARRRKEDREKDKGDMSGYHLIVLAKNYNGYKNLIQLVSNAWVDGYYMRPRTDRADLEKYHEDLIVCSACIAGEVPSKILHGDIEGAREACEGSAAGAETWLGGITPTPEGLPVSALPAALPPAFVSGLPDVEAISPGMC